METEKEQINAEFMTKLNLLAVQYSMSIEIDYETRNINFNGNPKDKLILAKEIDRIYCEYKFKMNELNLSSA